MPEFTQEQQAVIDKIDAEQANGVEETLLFSQDEQEYGFSFKRLSAYLLNFFLDCRNTLGQQIQMINSRDYASAPDNTIQRGNEIISFGIPPTLAAAINRQFSPERQAAVATYKTDTSSLLETNGLFNSDPGIRSMQENLLFGQSKFQMTAASLNLTPEQNGDAKFIEQHFMERFNNRYPENNSDLRPPQRAFVKRQFHNTALALAMGNKSLDDARDENGHQNGGAILDKMIDAMVERSKVTTETVLTPEQAVSSVSCSLTQFQTTQQNIKRDHGVKMQGILTQTFTDQRDENPYQIASTNPEIAKLQNDLLAGKIKPNDIDFEKFGKGVLAEAAAKDHSQRTRHLPLERKDDNPRTPGLILKAEAVGLMDELNELLNKIYPGIDPRSMAIKEDVKQQIPAVALTLALSPKEEAGLDVQKKFLEEKHNAAEKNYDATKQCARTLPPDTVALTQVHTKSGELLGVATQTYNVVNTALADMGIAPEPVPDASAQKSNTMSPRPN
ncbi:MAG: hypothetical protein WC748_05735 [Legionellales bacterium]|jgi:hypothetical protein